MGAGGTRSSARATGGPSAAPAHAAKNARRPIIPRPAPRRFRMRRIWPVFAAAKRRPRPPRASAFFAGGADREAGRAGHPALALLAKHQRADEREVDDVDGNAGREGGEVV